MKIKAENEMKNNQDPKATLNAKVDNHIEEDSHEEHHHDTTEQESEIEEIKKPKFQDELDELTVLIRQIETKEEKQLEL